MKKWYLGVLVLTVGLVACKQAEKYYVKEVTFPQGIGPEEKIWLPGWCLRRNSMRGSNWN